MRSPATLVYRRSAAPIHAGGHPLALPHIPALPLPGFTDPLSPGPCRSLTTGPPSDGSPQPVGDSCFSDIEDDGDGAGSAFLPDDTHASAVVPAARRPCVGVVCSAKRDSVRLGTYGYTRRPYVGPDMLVAQIVGRRAELAFLRSTWPRRPTQPVGIAPERAAPTAVALADLPSPKMASVAAADGATGGVMTEGPGTMLGLAATPALPPSGLVASVSDGRTAHAFGEPVDLASDGRPLFTVGTLHRGVAPTIASGEPIASVSDGRPARVLSGPIASISDPPPSCRGRRIPSGSSADPRSW